MGSELKILGTLSRLRGYEGAFLLLSETPFSDECIEELEQVFLLIEGLPVPFFVEYIDILSDNSLEIKFDDISSETEALEFVGSQVEYLPVEGSEDVTADREELVGYEVIDAKAGRLGVVTDILYYGENVLFSIEGEKDGREILFPVHDDLIEGIDDRSRTILVNAPEGLLDL